MNPIKVAIFASSGGSNAENIVQYFEDKKTIAQISLILTNNPEAGVIERARRLGVPLIQFDKKMMNDQHKIVEILINQKIDLIVLAGYLWLIPPVLIEKFPNRIINVHPALLPNYGGKGMYGLKVHEAVFANRERETGITIHYINEKFDEGEPIFQAKVEVLLTDSAKDIELKVHQVELEHFPKVIEKLCLSMIQEN